MPRRTRTHTSPMLAARGLSNDELARWADLIADGRDAFPADLPPPDRDQLRAEVRRRRRDRLVRHIARALALELRGQPT